MGRGSRESPEQSAVLAHGHGRTHAAAVQGGRTSGRAAAAAAGLGTQDSAGPGSRIQANPFLKGPAPTFVPRAGEAGAAGSASAKQRPRSSAANSGRLQHDNLFSLETP